ncbi:MAG: ABC transporter ATP-binding protein [Synergistaceae bacterium]|jgi:iron complex transport system ATP-binding protein|nr:ABC transporter ATP-binding protein [Synergistaceae bacterium]
MSAPGGRNAISISGLSLELGGTMILSDVSFEVPLGSLVCIVGRNGAGKSTLFKCVAGVIGNYSGELSISGRVARALSAKERSRFVAYVPQSSPIDIPYAVGEFMEMSRYPWRSVSSESEDRRAVAEAMEMAGIAGFADRRLGSLSGGERQKVMIASAIAQGAGTILMDEPTTYLDYAHQAETMDLIFRVNRERGVTVMVVTHDVNLAIGMAGAAVAMAGGRVIWLGHSSGLLDPGRLAEIFGVNFRLYSSEGESLPMAAPERGI